MQGQRLFNLVLHGGRRRAAAELRILYAVSLRRLKKTTEEEDRGRAQVNRPRRRGSNEARRNWSIWSGVNRECVAGDSHRMCVDGGMGPDTAGDGYARIGRARGAPIRRDAWARGIRLA